MPTPEPAMTTPRHPRSNLAACMIPWTEAGELHVEAFERHVTTTIDDGYRDLYLMGTAGEGYAVDDARYQSVVDHFARLTVDRDLTPQVGVISLSMQTVLQRIAYAHDRGIRMFQVSLPSWGALDESETRRFFQTVGGAFPEARFLHYNLPRAKRIIDGAEYSALADAVPNLVATKNSTYDYGRTADLMINAPQLQHFLLETNYAMGCTIGECSLLCSFAGLLPGMTHRFYEAGLAGETDTTFEITQTLYRLIHRLIASCGRAMIDGAYDKAFVWLRDPQFPPRLLPPYLGMSDEELRSCRETFESEFSDLLDVAATAR
jgi:dihydrodipicolinate synthase/N-acetylneuraminate lyase